MPTDLFKFESPDLVNLQKWLKRAPREFTRAANNTTNTVALQSRRQAIKNIEASTTTRNKKFVSRSMRVDKSKNVRNINQIVAEMGSIDISRQGRSTGFKELETGIISKNKRVPVMAARGNQERKPVSRPVRLNKLASAFRPSMFRGKGGKTQRAKVARMLRMVRDGAIGNKPFLVPRGVRTSVGKMPAGIWQKGRGRLLVFKNPTKRNVDKRTKRIKWMERAVDDATTVSNLKKIWKKEIDFVLRKRR